jgi:hypothetical protein
MTDTGRRTDTTLAVKLKGRVNMNTDVSGKHPASIFRASTHSTTIQKADIGIFNVVITSNLHPLFISFISCRKYGTYY